MKFKKVFVGLFAACMIFSSVSNVAFANTQVTEYTKEELKIIDTTGKFPQIEKNLELDDIKNEIWVKMITNYGDITIRLFPDKAPKAVENFVTHIKNDYYDGITFHRVIKDFMIQGGDPTGTGMGGESIWGKPFEDEFSSNLRHFRGALSMANSGENTNGSQFFIVQNAKLDDIYISEFQQILENQDEFLSPTSALKVKDLFSKDVIDEYLKNGGTPHLDFKHTVFGEVVPESMDVVDKIANVNTDQNDKPLEDVVIQDIAIIGEQTFKKLSENSIIFQLNYPKILKNMDLDGKNMFDNENTNVVPYSKNGRTLVPLRAIAEIFGAEVSWNESQRTANILLDGKNVSIKVGDLKMQAGENEISLDTPAEITEGRVFVPLRVIADAFGKEVYYTNKKVIIYEKSQNLTQEELNFVFSNI